MVLIGWSEMTFNNFGESLSPEQRKIWNDHIHPSDGGLFRAMDLIARDERNSIAKNESKKRIVDWNNLHPDRPIRVMV